MERAMIIEATGNLLDAQAEALVNTVNTVGVMGKGVALQFKKAFPENFAAYEKACKAGEVLPGKMFVFETGALSGPRFIFNFPTKRHWRGSSRMEDIEAGLNALVVDVQRLGVRSLAVPPLGCGNGGLDWNEVRPRIERAFAPLPEVRVLLFAPSGAPAPEKITNRTKRPQMTAATAATLGILGRYARFDYRLALLEVHKLVYFLNEAGEPLPRTRFEKGPYGPYADSLRHVLNRLEGHYVQGFGDASKNMPDTPIWLLPGTAEEAEQFLQMQPATLGRFERVTQLIEGFETPYGLELLSSVHWAARYEVETNDALSAVTKAVHSWNQRKEKLMKPQHVELAWKRLQQQGWLG
jgi:O-acetyl-ADP-ribose deacetylase (regulator of RNase III)